MITSYEGLDLGRYMKIDRILRTPAEEIDKQVQIVAILADKSVDDVLQLPLAEYSAMAVQTAFLGSLCPPAPVDGSPVEVAGLKLIPTQDFTKINTAQYVDFQTFARDFPSTIPELLSCFLVPEGRSYNEGYDVGKVQAAVRDLPLATAIGLTAFFFDSFKTSIADSLTSLEKTSRKNPEKMKEIAKIRARAETLLLNIGAGLPI